MSAIALLASPGLSQADDRASGAIQKRDQDGDGRISPDEWHKGERRFKKIDTDQDGYLTLEELRARFGEGGEGGSDAESGENAGDLEGRTTRAAIDEETLCAIARKRSCTMEAAIARGLFETGLSPRFPENADCRSIDDHYAMDYTFKRNREAYHGGIDLPAPFGTPMIAVADGTVVGKYLGGNSARGIEITLRHSPEDTGIPLWIYTQYAHFNEMPKQEVGQRVRMGEILGPTGNSGISPRTGEQSTRRRPAIHFAVFYSTSEKFHEHRGRIKQIIPVNGQWMDPNALFRKTLPLDSYSMKVLPEQEKAIPIPIKFEDGGVFPADTKLVWPYMCSRRGE